MKLIAFLIPTPQTYLPRGSYNGYVAIPPEHPCFEGDYFEPPICDLEVHGGATFSEPVCFAESTNMSRRKVKSEYIGTRNPLLDDAEYVTDETEIPDDWWILGFDTCHFGDNPIKWDKESVTRETLNLKKQLEKLSNTK